MEEIRISIVGDAKALQPTVDKLTEIGAVDKKNAEQFKHSNAEFEAAAKKREKLLKEEIEDLEELKRAKRAAFSPEEIKQYEQSIKNSQERVRLLSADMGQANKSMQQVVVQTNAFGESVKKSYGFLRIAANIIPGLGISGLILAGYEMLSSLIQEVTFSFEDNTEAIEFNNEAMEKHLEMQDKLQKILQTNIQQRLVLNKQLSDTDVARFKAMEDFTAREDEISKTKLENIKKLADAYKLDESDFRQYAKRIGVAGELTVEQLKAIEEGLKISENEGLPRSLDQRLAIIASFVAKIEELERNVRKERRDNSLALNEEVAAIEEKGFHSSLKKLKVKKEKEDDWWKRYLAWWKQNFDELLRMYKKDTDDFLKETERKNREAIKRDEDNIALILENNKLEASLTKDKVDDENARFQEEINNFEIQHDEKGQITEQSYRHLELLRKQHNQNLLRIQMEGEEAQNKLDEEERKRKKKKREEDLKETIENFQQITKFILDEYKVRIESNIEYIDHQQEVSRDAADAQRQLAIAGKENTLAFEEKRQADLERQRVQEAKKLKRAKELEIFLNAMAEFSKDDPKQALGKALALMATAIAAEATFAEEGGILGKINEKSWKGRKHKGGGDILVHAQTGEGIFSRKEVANMGGEAAFMNFKNLLANPITEKPIPLSGVMFSGMTDTRKLEQKIDMLADVFRNKAEYQVDWESWRDMHTMNITKIEKGIKETIKHQLKKPRL